MNNKHLLNVDLDLMFFEFIHTQLSEYTAFKQEDKNTILDNYNFVASVFLEQPSATMSLIRWHESSFAIRPVFYHLRKILYVLKEAQLSGKRHFYQELDYLYCEEPGKEYKIEDEILSFFLSEKELFIEEGILTDEEIVFLRDNFDAAKEFIYKHCSPGDKEATLAHILDFQNQIHEDVRENLLDALVLTYGANIIVPLKTRVYACNSVSY